MSSDEIKREIKEKYDKEVGIYDKYYYGKAAKHFMKRKIQTTLSFNKIRKGQKCLEIGSATGIFSFEFIKLGIDLVSIDLSSQNIKMAQYKNTRLGSNIDFQVGDIENLDFSDSVFDGVISFSTLRYVPKIKKALSEINRVLKPEGYVILDFPNKDCPWFNYLKKPLTGRKHIYDNQYNVRELRDLLIEAGFRDICFKIVLFTPKGMPNSILPFFKIIEYVGERLPIIKNSAAIIFCSAQKR